MNSKIFTLSLALLCASCALAQKVTLTSSATDTVRKGDVVAVTFTFDNVSSAGFELPPMKGLKIVSTPSRRSQLSVMNGVRNSTESLTYNMMAESAGQASIEAFEIDDRGKVLLSERLNFFVTDDPNYVAPVSDRAILHQPSLLYPAPPAPTLPPSKAKRETVKM